MAQLRRPEKAVFIVTTRFVIVRPGMLFVKSTMQPVGTVIVSSIAA
jgi:hypothetical protein